ncbi:unnamed protein product [Ranitomeya imitator]|uniref:Uncharacterized protein n=1 Tax=Ranitomeya imitator TaxID=111125 RepID=A0ABN9LXK1_9NEOB|nr:unnamed protein product [Ranitomeya imitator]
MIEKIANRETAEDVLEEEAAVDLQDEDVEDLGVANLLSALDPDSNPYSLLDNTESDQTVDTDASDSHHSTNRRRRSRRRRTDEDASLMDGMTESDNASVNENGLVTVADYISRAESQSRQRSLPKEALAKGKKEKVKEVIEEHGASEKVTNGPRGSNGGSTSKSSSAAPERNTASCQDGSTQEAILNGVS